MPAKSQQQLKLIYATRAKYGNKSKTPQTWKWVWDKEWTEDVKMKELPKKKNESIEQVLRSYVRKVISEALGGEAIEDRISYTIQLGNGQSAILYYKVDGQDWLIYYEIEGSDSIFSGTPITIAKLSKDFLNENQVKKIVQYFQYLYTKNVKIKPEGGVVQDEEAETADEIPGTESTAGEEQSGEIAGDEATPDRGPGGQFLPKGEAEPEAAPEEEKTKKKKTNPFA